MNQKYMYPTEKLNAARRILMLPHPGGEARSLAGAFHECSLGLKGFSDEDFDSHSQTWFRTIRETMDTTGVEDPSGEGTWLRRAKSLDVDQKAAFASAVDELADWCDGMFKGT